MNLNTKASFPSKLDIFDYFKGKTFAWGIFEDRFGNLRKKFYVNILGNINNKILMLDERFYYSNGDKDRRIWNINKICNYNYEGTADDINGIAKGISSGNIFYWKYKMKIKINNKHLNVCFSDKMFLLNKNVLINKAIVSKFGLKIGELSLFFKKN